MKRLLCPASVLALAVLLLTPAAVAAQTGNPAPNPAGGLMGLLPDPKQWAGDVFSQVFVNLLQSIATGLRQIVSTVLNSQVNVITRTPPEASYASATVQNLWGVMRTVANGALALAAMWAAFDLIAREQLGSPYHEAMEILPRLALGALLVNTSLSWAQLSIDANNALCGLVSQGSLPAWDQTTEISQLLIQVLATLIYLITALLLLLQMLIRIALLDVLVVVAPIALLCGILPQTQRWSGLWTSTFFGAVFTQFVQMVALRLGSSILGDLTPLGADGRLLSIFFGIALMALTLKIPGLIGRHGGDGLSFARYLAYRQAARGLDSHGSRGGDK